MENDNASLGGLKRESTKIVQRKTKKQLTSSAAQIIQNLGPADSIKLESLSKLIETCIGFTQKGKHALFLFPCIETNPGSHFHSFKTAVNKENREHQNSFLEKKGAFKINSTSMLFINFSDSKFYSLINTELSKNKPGQIASNSKITIDPSLGSKFLPEISNALKIMGFSANTIKIPLEYWNSCETLFLFESYAILSFSNPDVTKKFYYSLLENFYTENKPAKIHKCTKKIIIENFEKNLLAYNEINFLMENKIIKSVSIEQLEKDFDLKKENDSMLQKFIATLKSLNQEKSLTNTEEKEELMIFPLEGSNSRHPQEISDLNSLDTLSGPGTFEEWINKMPEDKSSYSPS